ncbi:biotin--[acetyl-CoA-carboxylase] ligase [Cochleicola gelatinilyticus]|uniref:BPL/LPL catalytic domain-containing protein n=1 Tax=Cochleicola gelatinilyticus TaxID=1763537 RepID=A0A167F4W6_9FLAO|nr:biotin--[acetyl-CoA-carboxylase] ligase [Cochleicola gelatinilyticus]OAB76196.1 hypothetical protein ULVI_14175 [Cochleicola gelatinilyticus]
MKIIKLNAIDSTNTYLKNLSRETRPEDGLVVVANAQTNGRGQVGASWQSKEGESLTFSVFKSFNSLPISAHATVLFTTAIAIKEALEQLNISNIEIKWPNDILAGGKKCCGVLIENQLQQDTIATAIVGVGLNVNETEFDELPQATSLHLASGCIFNLDDVLQHVSKILLKHLSEIERFSSEEIKTKYEASLFKKGVVSTFETPNGNQFSGIIRGVKDNGELIVEKEQDVIKTFEVKQIRLLY